MQLPTPLHRFGHIAFLTGAVMVAAALPLSNYMMSLGQFFMAGGWLLSADLQNRIKAMFRNPVFMLFTGLYFLHVLGLWNTIDFEYAFRDIRVKLPLLLMPVFFIGGPTVTKMQYRMLCFVLLGSVFLASIIGISYYLSGKIELDDFRSFSPFISHIRLSLLLVFSIFLSVDFIFQYKSVWLKLILFLLCLWFIIFLTVMQSMTGIFLLALIASVAFIIYLFRSGGVLRNGIAIVLILLSVASAYTTGRYIFVDSLNPGFPDQQFLKSKTEKGSLYTHDLQQVEMENGQYVWINYCLPEMSDKWKTRSKTILTEKDRAGNMQLATLLRYLTWCGLSKDAAGISQLTDEQIRDIENGIPTPEHRAGKMNLLSRIKELAREYRIYHYTGWAEGHTFAQRLEYQKAAVRIISENPITGVGTGDLPEAFKNAYVEIHSRLSDAKRLRAHNQYLSMAVAFGIPALLYMLWLLIYLMRRAIRLQNGLYVSFLLIAAGSFFSEDTLETQAGVTFFAFLAMLLLNPQGSKSAPATIDIKVPG